MKKIDNTRRVIYETKNHVIKVPRVGFIENFWHLEGIKLKVKSIISFYNICKTRIGENYDELRYQKAVNNHIAKTKLSVIGLLNVQERLRMLEHGIVEGFEDFLKEVEPSLIGNKNIGKLKYLSNYGRDINGKLKITDCGNKEICCFLEKHGDELIKKVEEKAKKMEERRKNTSSVIVSDEIKQMLKEQDIHIDGI